MKDQETWDDRYNLINHPYLHYGTFTTTVSITAGEESAAAVILANGAITITLPLAVDNKGRAFYIKNIGVGAVTVAPSGGDLIDGGAGGSLPDQYDVMLVVSDGTTNWWILSFSDL
jgi:hypothetical protein